MEAFYKKYFLKPLDEVKALKELILETKKSQKDETCFTLSLYGQIPPGRAEKLKNSEPINVYEVEIADDESITEYYYLDLDALNHIEDTDSEEELRALLIGEIDPREAPVLCKS